MELLCDKNTYVIVCVPVLVIFRHGKQNTLVQTETKHNKHANTYHAITHQLDKPKKLIEYDLKYSKGLCHLKIYIVAPSCSHFKGTTPEAADTIYHRLLFPFLLTV